MGNEKNKIEKRAQGTINKNEGIVEGYAAVFNEESTDIGFIEVIAPGAITEETIKRSDVFAVLDHDKGRGVLARSKYGKGSLSLKVDSKGFHYSFNIQDTPVGSELRAHLEAGDIDSSSFAFTVISDKWEKRGDSYLRTILEIEKIYDVSPAYSPIYEGAGVALRSLEAFKESESAEANRAIAAEKEKEQRERDLYYSNLKTKIETL